MTFSVSQTKNKLTHILQLVEQGEHVTICQHGRRGVNLVPIKTEERRNRVFGAKRAIIVDGIGLSPKTISMPGFEVIFKSLRVE